MTTSPADRVRTVDEQVGERVHMLMFRNRITQTQLAADLGMQQSAVSRKLRGSRAWLASELVVVAELLGVAPAQLLPEGPGEPSPQPDGPSPGAQSTHEGTKRRYTVRNQMALRRLRRSHLSAPAAQHDAREVA